MSPVATLCVLNYERREILRRCLTTIQAQALASLEVIVVDNASTDGSDRMVEADFPGMRLLRMAHNMGCAARNAGVAAARAPIVVTIDNDVMLESGDGVAQVLRLFEDRPGLACVDFKILDAEGGLSRRDWCHPRDPDREAEETFLTDYVLEGACAFRRDAFVEVGGYWEPFFLGHEGLDLALRLLDAGHEILYSPKIAVRHLVSVEARPSSRIYHTFTRNAVWLAIRNHRLGPATRAVALDLALMAFSSLRARQGRTFVRGLTRALVGCAPAFRSRRPLSPVTYRRLKTIRRQEPGFLSKVRRHWAERPI